MDDELELVRRAKAEDVISQLPEDKQAVAKSEELLKRVEWVKGKQRSQNQTAQVPIPTPKLWTGLYICIY